jgi:hypothetical protein
MADVQQQDSSTSSPAIADLAGSGGSSAIADLTRMQQARTQEDFSITRQSDKRMEQDRGVMEQAFKAEGVAASEQLKPWDANKEHKKFEEDPIAGFGSVGGLFAMVASAFTKAPMENAINGMAGAINSIKAGDEAAYERAHQSWQENTKLALERFKTQHELYSDALSLMSHDQAAASAKLNNAAVRFGDSQTLMLAEHGMVKELFELQASRASAAEQTQKALDSTTDAKLRQAGYKALTFDLPNSDKSPQAAAKRLNAWTTVHNLDPKSPQMAILGQYMFQHPDAKVEDIAKFADDHGIIRQYGTAGGSGAASLIPGRADQAIVNKRAAEMRTEDPSLSEVDAYEAAKREVKISTTPPSANRTDDLRAKIDQTDNILSASQKNLDFLHQFKGGAGLMGKIMRGEEIASNIVGAGTQSERVEFRRRVHELQEMVPRIITDSNGRPLKAAQDKVDDFVAGLNAGDTGPNTIRAYEELISEMKKRQQDYRGRIEGGYEAGSKSSGTPAGGAQQAPGNTDWLNAYPVKGGDKRSDSGTSGSTDFSSRNRIPGESGPEEGQKYKQKEVVQRIQEAIEAAEAKGQEMSAEEVIAMVKGLIGSQGARLLATERAP